MTTERFSWLLCGWALLVLLHGAVESLAQVSAKRVEDQLHQEEVGRLASAGYAAALRKLEEDPYWSGQLPELNSGELRCRMKVSNHTSSFISSFEGRTWLPPHSALLEGLVLLDQSGGKSSPFQNVVEYQRPSFEAGTSTTEVGPFTSPLRAAGSPNRRTVAGKQTLPAGSYDEVTVEPGAVLTLVPARECYTFRFRLLSLKAGAALNVVGDTPAVLYIGQALSMDKSSANDAGPSAMLQIYLLPGAAMSLRDCLHLSLVAAGSTIKASRCEIDGALRAGNLELDQCQVLYDEKLRGLALDGLGPLYLRDAISPP